MFPREHGAYAQIGFPLVTALALGRPGLTSVLLVAAIVAVFLLHEPLMVLIGGRGGRAKREAGAMARRRAATLIGVALAAGGSGLWLASPMTRTTALIPLTFGALLVPLIFSRREKTAVGELLVAWSLSTTMIPVAVAGGVDPGAAIAAAGVWAVAFSLSTVTVRAIIARAKKNQPSSLAPMIAPALCAVVIASALLLAVRGDFPTLVPIAVVPTALVALTFGLLGVHPRNLRRMGWSLVASNLAVLAALLVGLR